MRGWWLALWVSAPIAATALFSRMLMRIKISRIEPLFQLHHRRTESPSIGGSLSSRCGFGDGPSVKILSPSNGTIYWSTPVPLELDIIIDAIDNMTMDLSAVRLCGVQHCYPSLMATSWCIPLEQVITERSRFNPIGLDVGVCNLTISLQTTCTGVSEVYTAAAASVKYKVLIAKEFYEVHGRPIRADEDPMEYINRAKTWAHNMTPQMQGLIDELQQHAKSAGSVDSKVLAEVIHNTANA